MSPWATVPLCDACWERDEPGRVPVRIAWHGRAVEHCASCGAITCSGIYARRER